METNVRIANLGLLHDEEGVVRRIAEILVGAKRQKIEAHETGTYKWSLEQGDKEWWTYPLQKIWDEDGRFVRGEIRIFWTKGNAKKMKVVREFLELIFA